MNPHGHCIRALLVGLTLVFMLSGTIAGSALADDPEDKLGNWFNLNSTIRFTDRWSAFVQGEMRLWEPVSNLNETLFRFAGHYDINEFAMVGLGYVRVDTWPFDDGGSRFREENRIYQQFALKQSWGRAKLEHRFRLEQRWFPQNDGDSYSNRARYKLGIKIPLNYETIQPGAYFLKALNETFINFNGGERTFDQNRLAGAVGYQFTPSQNLQMGLLWQARSSEDFMRLQIYYTLNFDMRKRLSQRH
jgi:hypothetical protein